MISTTEIERIVREVLAEMTSVAAPSATPEKKVEKPAATAAVAKPHDNRELTIDSRLITLGDVGGRLVGIRRLVVRPGAVITPAVKEEIAKRNIQVATDAAAKESASGRLKMAIVVARTKFDPQPISAALQNEQIEVELFSSKCLLEATERIAGEVKKADRLGLILTPYEAETLCLANRLPGVRAVAGREPVQVAADVAAIGANVLVVNPKKTGPYAIRQIMTEYCRGGVRACPEVFKGRLG
jgi:hypothetical protein